MTTIKLPIQNQLDIEIFNYLREFNSCIRLSYNRFVEDLKLSDIGALLVSKKLFPRLDSWFKYRVLSLGNVRSSIKLRGDFYYV